MGRGSRGREKGARKSGGGRGAELATASGLLAHAERLLAMGNAEQAKQGAGKALKLLSAGVDEDAIIKDGAGERKAVPVAALPALNLLAEIEIELGDAVAARRLFEKTVELDPEGSIPEAAGGGAEKFLWLAQLCEEGGMASVRWYERGAEVLRGDIARLGSEGTGGAVEERRKKLAAALCSIAEVYMTDLSWEIDAEARCEALIAQALLITPSNAETLQTLANIRISQGRIEEAKKALTDSIGIWQGKMEDVPPFPTRISLARLLLEVHEEEPALKVVERLVREDDQSVEAWYLGGWCLYLLGTQTSTNEEHAGHSKSDTDERKHAALISSREWLRQSLALCTALEYEDERLREHAEELVGQLDDLLRSSSVDGEQEEGEKWESEGDDEEGEEGQDEEMFGTWKQL